MNFAGFSAPFLLALAMPSASRAAEPFRPITLSSRTAVFAVIGDTPYGEDQALDLPNLIAAIDADPEVGTVIHLGDIKTGSSRCDSERFEDLRDQFDRFADPFLYTPGDNEWTDCHRSEAGRFDPLGRLAELRRIFLPVPGLSLGQRKRWVFTQAQVRSFERFRENQLWLESSVVFALLHVVGSNNGLAPWFDDEPDDRLVDPTKRRIAEVDRRIEAALDWLDASFLLASLARAHGVALFMQADLWDSLAIAFDLPRDGYTAIIRHIAELAAAYGRPVLIVQGDSHTYRVDQPLALADPSLGVTTLAPNVTRVVVEGDTTREWLRLTVDPRTSDVFRWQRMPR